MSDKGTRNSTRWRREEIVRLVATDSVTEVDTLATMMGVTASTIRRDLAALTGKGRLARTYGGAISLPAHPETSLRQRLGIAASAKRAIGGWAAAQVLPGEVILLDSGSTTAAMAANLVGAQNITVTTTGVGALQELLDAPDVNVVSLGGRLRSLSQGFVGPVTEASLDRMSFDRAFMGADGVTADRGICEAELEQTRLKELMMRRAEHVYVLAHSAKLGQRPFHAWALMPPKWTVVTDSDATSDQLREFHERGVEVVVVDYQKHGPDSTP